MKRHHLYLLGTALSLTSALSFAADDNLNNLFSHYPTVTTYPLFGDNSEYDSFDLLYQETSENEDWYLLKDHQKLSQAIAKKGGSFDRPIIAISGGVEGGYTSQGSYTSNTDNSLALSTAELDVAAFINDWATTFFSFDYANNEANQLGPADQLYLSRGFLTIGNLNHNPFYVTVGKNYTPFGRYSTDMITPIATNQLGRILSTIAEVGYANDNGLFASVFSYNGEQSINNNDIAKQGGGEIGMRQNDSQYPYEVGVSVISNLADSQGMNDTDGGTFAGFSSNYSLAHRVPAVDAYGIVNVGSFTFINEYVTATEAFDSSDLAFNSEGAKPRALTSEIEYNKEIHSKPVTFAMAYNHSWEALAINMPENSYQAIATVSLWRDTLESLEYRHDVDYDSSDTASGQTGGTFSGTGKSKNTVLLSVGAYF